VAIVVVDDDVELVDELELELLVVAR